MAAKGYYLTQGDKTTCGGKIITGAEDHTLFNKPVAREQDSVTCGRHTGLYRIAGGISNDLIHGRRMAGTLDSYSACPCKAKFIPSMLSDTYEKESSNRHSAEEVSSPEVASPKVTDVQTEQLFYTVTIYAAYPGTPLNTNGEPKINEDGERETSLGGHMWIKISKITKTGELEKDNSYGFSPKNQGSSSGAGHVTITDTEDYENPYYSRTLEIHKEQYDELQMFGESAKKENPIGRLDLHYDVLRNSCIDFTFQALRYAELEPKAAWNDLSFYNLTRKAIGNFDGDLKVINNIPHVKSIPAPFPDSILNSYHYNAKPNRTIKQRFISEVDSPSDDITSTYYDV